MEMTTTTASALRYAADLVDRAAAGADLGDTIGVGMVYDGFDAGKARVELHLFNRGGDVAARAAAVRTELGGVFGENDPEATPFDRMYLRTERVEQDFLVAVVVLREAVETITVAVDESQETNRPSARRRKAAAK